MIWFVRWLDSKVGPKDPEGRTRYDEAWGRAGLALLGGAALYKLVDWVRKL
jgi:hypothetical protein